MVHTIKRNLPNPNGSEGVDRFPSANFYFTGKGCHLERPGLKITITRLRPDIQVEADVSKRILSLTIPEPATFETLQFREGRVHLQMPGLKFQADTNLYCGVIFFPRENKGLRIDIPIPRLVAPAPAASAVLQEENKATRNLQQRSDVNLREPSTEPTQGVIHAPTASENNSVAGGSVSHIQPVSESNLESTPPCVPYSEVGTVDEAYEQCRALYDADKKGFGSYSNDPRVSQFINRIQCYARAIAMDFFRRPEQISDFLDDVVQGVTILTLEKLGQFQGNSQFSTWLYTVSWNFYRAAVRPKSRKVQLVRETDCTDTEDRYNTSFIDLASQHSQAQGGEGEWAQERDAQERMRLFDEVLKTLTPGHQSVLQAILDGMKYDQIAKQHELKIGTVRSRINRAKMSLKEALQDRLTEQELADLLG